MITNVIPDEDEIECDDNDPHPFHYTATDLTQPYPPLQFTTQTVPTFDFTHGTLPKSHPFVFRNHTPAVPAPSTTTTHDTPPPPNLPTVTGDGSDGIDDRSPKKNRGDGPNNNRNRRRRGRDANGVDRPRDDRRSFPIVCPIRGPVVIPALPSELPCGRYRRGTACGDDGGGVWPSWCDGSAPLGVTEDGDFVDELWTFLRSEVFEVFGAVEEEVVLGRTTGATTVTATATPVFGESPMVLGRVGVRCRHCHCRYTSSSNSSSSSPACYRFPESIEDIRDAARDLFDNHVDCCPSLPPLIKSTLQTLKASDVPMAGEREEQYWIDSAVKLGLIDTGTNGIAFGRNPNDPLPPLRGPSAASHRISALISSPHHHSHLPPPPLVFQFNTTYVYTDGDVYSSFANIPPYVQHVVVHHAVTHVHGRAFRNVSNLRSVDFSHDGRLTSIGPGAFEGCTSLEKIVLPRSVRSLGSRCFYGCRGLVGVALAGEGPVVIGAEAFGVCVSLTSFSVAESDGDVVMEEGYSGGGRGSGYVLPERAKGGDPTYLARLTSGATTVGSRAFSGCVSLASVVLPSGTIALDSGAFEGCAALTTLRLPSSLVCFPADAFEGCTSLPSLVSGGSIEGFARREGFAPVNLDDVLYAHRRSRASTHAAGTGRFYYRAAVWSEWASSPSLAPHRRRPLSQAACSSLPWCGGVEELFRSCMTAVYDVDGKESGGTGLGVFMLAAVGDGSDLECVYRLLREFPPAIGVGVSLE